MQKISPYIIYQLQGKFIKSWSIKIPISSKSFQLGIYQARCQLIRPCIHHKFGRVRSKGSTMHQLNRSTSKYLLPICPEYPPLGANPRLLKVRTVIFSTWFKSGAYTVDVSEYIARNVIISGEKIREALSWLRHRTLIIILASLEGGTWNMWTRRRRWARDFHADSQGEIAVTIFFWLLFVAL